MRIRFVCLLDLYELSSAGDAAVRLALGEAQTIAETKKFFEEHGVTVEPPPGPVVRSRTVLIVKNLPYNTGNNCVLHFLVCMCAK